jgi:hypothetical protein
VDVLIENKFALANFVVGLKMLDELEIQWRVIILVRNLQILYLPTQLAALLTNKLAMLQAGKFCLAESNDGFVLADEDGKDLLDRKGSDTCMTSSGREFSRFCASSMHYGIHCPLKQ